MTKRVKPVLNIPTVSTVEEADATLAEIAARKRQISLHEIALKEDVDKLKAECAARCEPLKKDIEAREQALVQFALARREELFKNRKSRELTFGTIGFRVSSSLRTIKKMTWERVLGVLKERGMTHCIRIKEEVDKEALRTLGPNTLADVGCKLTQEDAFFYDLNEAELEGSRT